MEAGGAPVLGCVLTQSKLGPEAEPCVVTVCIVCEALVGAESASRCTDYRQGASGAVKVASPCLCDLNVSRCRVLGSGSPVVVTELLQVGGDAAPTGAGVLRPSQPMTGPLGHTCSVVGAASGPRNSDLTLAACGRMRVIRAQSPHQTSAPAYLWSGHDLASLTL
ncbi:hypothetical protein CB1_000436019 [Camelus ferus]|nr:hypothetical protein CB1_000436019 [Camelus ferus]